MKNMNNGVRKVSELMGKKVTGIKVTSLTYDSGWRVDDFRSYPFGMTDVAKLLKNDAKAVTDTFKADDLKEQAGHWFFDISDMAIDEQEVRGDQACITLNNVYMAWDSAFKEQQWKAVPHQMKVKLIVMLKFEEGATIEVDGQKVNEITGEIVEEKAE